MPISDCEVRDPRIRRTRQLLQGALRTLMESKSFDEISVQDITEAATVNRATFYDHYTDKFALLEAMVGGGFHKLLLERKVRFAGGCSEALGAIVLAACDYLLQTCGFARGQRETAFQPLMDAAVTRAIRRVLLEGAPELGDGVSWEMVASATSGAIYGAVKEWHSTPGRVAAEEMVGPVVRLVWPMLEAGAARGVRSGGHRTTASSLVGEKGGSAA